MQLVSSPSGLQSVAKFARHSIQLGQKFAGAIRCFRAGVRDGIDLRLRYDALARLSDRALAKRGLTRKDIARAALDECQRRK